LLVAFAGEKNDISGLSPAERRGDCLTAIGDAQEIDTAPLADSFGSSRDLIKYCRAILAARVFVRHDDEAAALSRNPTHHRSLLDITLARRTEDGDKPTTPRRGHRREQVKDLLQRRWRVRIVDDHSEWLPTVHSRHPAGNAIYLAKTPPYGFRVEVESLTQGDGRACVQGVEATRDVQLHGSSPAWSDNFNPE
jgi:hypothetical protein